MQTAKGERGSSSLSAPLTSLSLLCLSTGKTSGRGPCQWRNEEGNVHSNILSGASTLSVGLTSICGSGWIECGEDAAAPISDVLLARSLFVFSVARTRSKLLGKGDAHPLWSV